jgi:hypothetical protein
MKPKFTKPAQGDANGQAALAIVTNLLDVLAHKTKTVSPGQVHLILDQAERSLPQSPHAVDEEAKSIIGDLRTQFKRP